MIRFQHLMIIGATAQWRTCWTCNREVVGLRLPCPKLFSLQINEFSVPKIFEIFIVAEFFLPGKYISLGELLFPLLFCIKSCLLPLSLLFYYEFDSCSPNSQTIILPSAYLISRLFGLSQFFFNCVIMNEMNIRRKKL
jgi:hypothetical protein